MQWVIIKKESKTVSTGMTVLEFGGVRNFKSVTDIVVCQFYWKYKKGMEEGTCTHFDNVLVLPVEITVYFEFWSI